MQVIPEGQRPYSFVGEGSDPGSKGTELERAVCCHGAYKSDMSIEEGGYIRGGIYDTKKPEEAGATVVGATQGAKEGEAILSFTAKRREEVETAQTAELV